MAGARDEHVDVEDVTVRQIHRARLGAPPVGPHLGRVVALFQRVRGYWAESFPTRVRGTAIGWLGAMFTGGLIVGSGVWTVLIGSQGARTLLIVGGGFALLQLLGSFLLLSQPVAHDGPAWAAYDPPTITRNYRRAAEGFNAETVRLNTHTGTHVDVPYHFDNDGPTVDQLPLSAFAAPAVFLDLRDTVAAAEPIGAEQLRRVLDLVQPGDIAVLTTGWGTLRASSERYLKRWPYLDGEGASALLERDVGRNRLFAS